MGLFAHAIPGGCRAAQAGSSQREYLGLLLWMPMAPQLGIYDFKLGGTAILSERIHRYVCSATCLHLCATMTVHVHSHWSMCDAYPADKGRVNSPRALSKVVQVSLKHYFDTKSGKIADRVNKISEQVLHKASARLLDIVLAIVHRANCSRLPTNLSHAGRMESPG